MKLNLSPLVKRNNIEKGSSHDPELEIDLKDIFGELPKRADALKQAIGGELLARIRNHAKEAEYFRQKGKVGEYTEEYENSFDFKVFGKRKGMTPDLTQSSFMLDDLDFEPIGESKLKFEFGELLNKKKAHGHITGAVGKQRDFFGLSEGDIALIKKEFKASILREKTKEEEGVLPIKRRPGESVISFLRRALRDGIDNG